MSIRALLPAAVFVALFSVSPAFAQDPKNPPPDEPTPTMTTEDVIPVQVAPAADPQAADAPAADDSMTPEERADAAASAKAPGGDEGQSDAAAPKGKKVSQAELDWRNRYSEADEAANAAERAALDAELRANQMKNELAGSSTVAERNNAAAALEAQGEEVRRLRAEAAAARAEANRVKAVGDRGRFKPDAGPSATTKDGAINPAYFALGVQNARTKVADAERRIEVYQSRIVELRGRILQTTGSGDNFAVARIKDELAQAEADLSDAQAARDAAQVQLDQAQTEASAAGVRVP